MSNHEELWDVEENVGFVSVLSNVDNLHYKVFNYTGENERQIQQQVADTLATQRRNINYLLFYLIQNQDLWIDNNIAFGILHTFDIHIPCWKKHRTLILRSEINPKLSNFINFECLKMGKLYNMQEMPRENLGLWGLNKPKEVTKLKDFNGYKMASKRSMHLTIRNKSKEFITNLVIHELTHTTCNDIMWKEENHAHPYPVYHRLMRKWAREINLI